MLIKLKKYLRLWFISGSNAFQEAFVNRGTNLVFLLGKAIRFAMSLVVLLLMRQNIPSFAGYTTDQLLIFFLTYQFVDVLAQTFYRGVYTFTRQIRNGELDFLLLKPVNPLFMALTGAPDINDAVFLVPTTLLSIYIISQLSVTITLSSLFMFGLLMINSFLIASALHILILAATIFITEVDGLVWLYRDLIRLGQFPVTIYLEPLRFALFFIIPIGAMITIPAQTLVSITPTIGIGLTLVLGIGSLLVSLAIWRWSLQFYSSASS